jgi:hypothetical protein
MSSLYPRLGEAAVPGAQRPEGNIGEVNFVRIGEAIIDLDRREVVLRGRRTRLEPKAAAVLALLAARRGAPVTRGEILDEVWPAGEGSDEGLTRAIFQLRKAFGEDGRSQGRIRTVPKKGYFLAAEEGLPPPLPVRRMPSVAAWLGVALLGAILLIVAAAALGLFGGEERIADCRLKAPGERQARIVPCPAP